MPAHPDVTYCSGGVVIAMTRTISFSRGVSKYDNKPEQCTAESFDAFEAAVLSDRAQAKGQQYICAPMDAGLHNNPEKYHGIAHWRNCTLAKPRGFLPLDVDGVDTPKTFEKLRDVLSYYRGFAYTTASSKPEAPRCRVVLVQTCETDRGEGIALCAAFRRIIEARIGAGHIDFDASVDKAEQPLYTPLIDAEWWSFKGAPVDVDALLAAAPKVDRPKLTIIHDSSLALEPFVASYVAWGLAVLDADDYTTWFNSRAWLKAAYGSAAYPLWLAWSQTASEEHRASEDKCAQAWCELIPRIPPGAGAGRFFLVARDAAIEVTKRARDTGNWGDRELAALALLRAKFKREYARLFDDRSAA